MTLRALQAGASFVIGVFISALVLHVLGSDLAERAASLGVLGLMATPAIALAATAVDRWNAERSTALLAIAVLAVLGAAAAVAWLIGG